MLRLSACVGSETSGSGMTKMKRLVIKIGRLHLDRQMIDAESIMQLGA
jgi:hypothetical protein